MQSRSALIRERGGGARGREKTCSLPRKSLKGGVWIRRNQSCQGQLCVVRGKATRSPLVYMRKQHIHTHTRDWKRLFLPPPASTFGQCVPGGAKLPKAMGSLIPRGNSSAGHFRVPGSRFRMGWEDSCFPERNLTLGKRGVPLAPTRSAQPRGPWLTLGPFPVTANA